MKKIILDLSPRAKRFVPIFCLFVFLIIFSAVWRAISAEDPISNLGDSIMNSTTSATVVTSATSTTTSVPNVPAQSTTVVSELPPADSVDVSNSNTAGEQLETPVTAPATAASQTNPPITPPIPKMIPPIDRYSTSTTPKAVSPVKPPVKSESTPPILTTSESSSKIQNLGVVVEERQRVVDDSKEQLVEIINQSITDIVKDDEKSKRKTDTAKINTLRDGILENVDSSLSKGAVITPADINNLKTEINEGIRDITRAASLDTAVSKTNNQNLEDIANTLDLLSEAVSNQSLPLRKQEAELLYQDSNNDGISDYDSIYVYGVDPTLPSVVSVYEGKNISAGDKILLGFDPAQIRLVKVRKEQPLGSNALTVLTYKVEEVVSTEANEILIRGQALPNSFITLYIYSTPIVVTVKTDDRGKWQYILDKELENGDHAIYTATVNNSGNIIAKSPPYLFAKTAEAITFKGNPAIGSYTDANEPGLLKNYNLYAIAATILVIVIMILILIGITVKKNREN